MNEIDKLLSKTFARYFTKDQIKKRKTSYQTANTDYIRYIIRTALFRLTIYVDNSKGHATSVYISELFRLPDCSHKSAMPFELFNKRGNFEKVYPVLLKTLDLCDRVFKLKEKEI